MNREEALQVLDGLMLGDGCLTRFQDTAVYQMNQCKHTISPDDHLKWEYWLKENVFNTLGIGAAVRPSWSTYSVGKKKGQKFQQARLWTERSSLLAQVYDEGYTGGEWVKNGAGIYIHNATKILPRRLMEASTLPIYTLVHWFLGDGGSARQYLSRPTPRVVATLSTYGFTIEEVYHLMAMLNNMGVWTNKPAEHIHTKGSGLRICLSQYTIDHFMSLIEPHVLEIFGDSEGPSYKDVVKYRDSNFRELIRAENQKTETEFNSLRERVGIKGG